MKVFFFVLEPLGRPRFFLFFGSAVRVCVRVMRRCAGGAAVGDWALDYRQVGVPHCVMVREAAFTQVRPKSLIFTLSPTHTGSCLA